MGLLHDLADFCFPRFCILCGRRLDITEETICLHCNIDLPRTSHWKDPYNNILTQRFWGRIPIRKASSYIYFTPHSKAAEIVYDFKYHHNKAAARDMGKLMALEMSVDGFFDDIDVIVPIPITFRRLFKRGYNQSKELANGISSVTGIPVVSNILARNTFKISQTLLMKNERIENVDNAFYLKKNPNKLEGKHILIIDDIITTGSTTISGAKNILKIRGTAVSVLSFGCIKHIH